MNFIFNFLAERTEIGHMTLEKLDYLFPFLVLTYGILMTFVLENRYVPTGATLRGHKNLAWTCLFVGALWSLQNLWLGTH